MELIKEIYEKDLGYTDGAEEISYKLRKAARSIVMNDLGKIALLYVSKNNYHKLPGGGVEAGEDISIALNREIMEEVGVNIDVLGEVGIIIEYRDNFKQLQISYCYYSKVKGDIKNPHFTEYEKSHGFELNWVDFHEAISILEKDTPNDYVVRFIQNRDLQFLKRAYEILSDLQ